MPSAEIKKRGAHSSKSEVPEDGSGDTTRYTAVPDLGGPGVSVHLGQLQLRLSTGTLGESGVADHIAESLTIQREMH